MGSRRKARECALQMLFAADLSGVARPDELVRDYWEQLGEPELDEGAREFASRLAVGTLAHQAEIDERIRSRAERESRGEVARGVVQFRLAELRPVITHELVGAHFVLPRRTHDISRKEHLQGTLARLTSRTHD